MSGQRPLVLIVLLMILAACGTPTGDSDGGDAGVGTGSPGATDLDDGEDGEEISGGDDGAGTEADPCALVTIEEVSAALGTEITDATTLDTTCSYEAAGDEAGIATTFQALDQATADSVFGSWASDESAEEVDGIGDRAVWSPVNSLLVVQKGSGIFSIATRPEQRDAAEEIARAAAGRMP